MKILVDTSQLMISHYMVAHRKGVDEGLLLKEIQNSVRYTVLNNLLSIRDDFQVDIKDIVLCCDSSNIWRYDKFQFYKGKRKLNKQKSDVDHEEMKKFVNGLIDDLDNILARYFEKSKPAAQG